MSENTYPYGLLARLLEHLPELAQGYYPHQGGAPEGYRGHQIAEQAPYEVAIIAYVDIMAAIARLPGELRGAAYRRFWEGRRTVEPWNMLVEAIWREINGMHASLSSP